MNSRAYDFSMVKHYVAKFCLILCFCVFTVTGMYVDEVLKSDKTEIKFGLFFYCMFMKLIALKLPCMVDPASTLFRDVRVETFDLK